jgi:vacuolar-type H+-ATPase subunit H
MNARVELPASPEVDAAIMRVLAAEQAARAEVERCKREAEQILEDAHRRGREIAERAARRVVRVHLWTDEAIAARVASLEAQRSALLKSAHEQDDGTALARAVERLADELAGSPG